MYRMCCFDSEISISSGERKNKCGHITKCVTKKNGLRKDQRSCQTVSPTSVNLRLSHSERQLFLWGEPAGR